MTPIRRNIPHHSGVPLISTTHEEGQIVYPDVEALNRPLEPPAQVYTYAKKIMFVAAIISALILIWYLVVQVTAPMREREAFEKNLNRSVALELPSLAALMPLNDEEIVAALENQDINLYERSAPGSNADGSFELIKLPSDVSLEEAAGIYLQGLDNVSDSQLIRLLNGSWFLTVFHDPTSIRVRYADLTSGSIEVALSNAMAAEGLSESSISEEGVDDAGNTYKTGLLVTKAATYTWRVSVIPLSAVYDISGLPSTACYVGIRFTVS